MLHEIMARGSGQYDEGQRIILVRQVIQLMSSWCLCLDQLEDHERNGFLPLSVYKVGDEVPLGSLVESNLILALLPRQTKCQSWGAACEVVAQRSGVCKNNLRAWTYEYLNTGKLEVVIESRQSRQIFSGSKIPPAYVLEMLEVLYRRRLEGLTTNNKIMQQHLNGNVRFHELCLLADCPPMIWTDHAIGRALRRSGAVSWKETHKVGKLGELDPLKLERRLWRLRVFGAEMVLARQEEIAGRAVVAQMDESFCNVLHQNEMSMCPTEEGGAAMCDIYGAKGKGVRLCLVCAVTSFGPMVCKQPDGEWVRDHEWQNSAGKRVMKNGKFCELNNEGKPRQAYLRQQREEFFLDKMTKKELLAMATDLGLSLDNVSKLKDEIYEYIKLIVEDDDDAAPVGEVQAASGEEVSAEQVVLMDFGALAVSLSDQAHTTLKMFEANKPKGDYHKNFDTVTFFKWFQALVTIYPE
jgi:hypothetical protein